MSRPPSAHAHIPDGPLGLYTDLYELRMAQTCLREGLTGTATFSLYIRPTTARPWFLAAGTDAALDLVERATFDAPQLDHLRGLGFGDDLLGWLAELEPTGEVWAVRDGTVVLGDEPLLEYTAPLPVCLLLETAIMNVVHFPTVIATKAARCVVAARGRAVADFGLRRAHGLQSGVEAARAAYIGGVTSTSNVEASHRYGIAPVGTMAHAFIQAHGDELEAFRAFARDHPDNAVLLVDTYDSIQGVRHAIEVGRELRARGHALRGVRLDSGDLDRLAREARRMLDEAGFDDSAIFVSGGVDEFEVHELVSAGAPIDAFGVGTSLTTSRDHPAVDIAYKLVEYEGHGRAKYSTGKVLLPGAKQVFRDGGPDRDVLGRRDEELPGERLLEALWRDGADVVPRDDLETARERAQASLDALPPAWRDPFPRDSAPGPRLSAGLEELAAEVRRAELGG